MNILFFYIKTLLLRPVFILAFLLAFSSLEGRQITGRVLDNETQKPVRDANIIILGTTQGTKTNFLGFFSLNVDEQNKELIISSIGYLTSKIEIPATDQFKIILTREYLILKEFNLAHYYLEDLKPIEYVPIESNSSQTQDRDAEYPGGWDVFYNNLGFKLKNESIPPLPPDSILKIKFTINVEGRITDVQVEPSNPDFLLIFNNAISGISKWRPAVQNNNLTPQFFILPSRWSKSEEVYVVIEESAIPSGGYPAFYKFIGDHIKYPKEARHYGIEGRVFIEFIVNRDGSLSDFIILKGIGGGCDEETLRLVSMSPSWIPGKQKGKPVRQKMVLPITYSLGGSFRSSSANEMMEIIDRRDNLHEWISTTMRYPAKARRMGVEGWVYAEIKIDKNSGEILSSKLLNDIGAECGYEVLRVISTISPEAILNLKPSKENLILPVGFGLDHVTKKPDESVLVNDSVEILKPVEIVAVGIERQRLALGSPVAGPYPLITATIRDRNKPLPPQSFSEASKKSISLSLVSKSIEVIPTEIETFKNLKFLDLENNQITHIPEEFGQLENLSEFHIPINKLKGLPSSFGNLQNLKILGLAQNEFTEFPHGVTKLVKLIALDLANNKIKNLPAEINQLKNLHELYLQNNEITRVPPELFELTRLKKLYLEGNPIKEEDKTILKQRLSKVEIHF